MTPWTKEGEGRLQIHPSIRLSSDSEDASERPVMYQLLSLAAGIQECLSEELNHLSCETCKKEIRVTISTDKEKFLVDKEQRLGDGWKATLIRLPWYMGL